MRAQSALGRVELGIVGMRLSDRAKALVKQWLARIRKAEMGALPPCLAGCLWKAAWMPRRSPAPLTSPLSPGRPPLERQGARRVR